MGLPLPSEPSVPEEIRQWKKDPLLRELVLKHSRISFAKHLGFIAVDWIVIFGTAGLSRLFFHPLSYLAAAFVIATRQHALLIIMHDGAHFRLSNKRLLNDLTSDFLTAFPFLASTSWYRNHHAEHHRHLNTERDPDWARKVQSPEWQFPQAPAHLAKTLLKQVVFGGFEWVSLMVLMGVKAPEGRRAKILKLVYYLTAVTVIQALNLWTELALYWAVPLLFIFPSLQRFRSMTEHFGLERSHEFKDARNTEAGPVESFLLSPHGTNYHLVHHLFPGIPHYNLAKAHEELKRFPLYEREAHRNDSYLFSENSVLNDLLAGPPKKES